MDSCRARAALCATRGAQPTGVPSFKPLQDIVSFQRFIVSHPFIAPLSTCKAYTIAILLDDP